MPSTPAPSSTDKKPIHAPPGKSGKAYTERFATGPLAALPCLGGAHLAHICVILVASFVLVTRERTVSETANLLVLFVGPALKVPYNLTQLLHSGAIASLAATPPLAENRVSPLLTAALAWACAVAFLEQRARTTLFTVVLSGLGVFTAGLCIVVSFFLVPSHHAWILDCVALSILSALLGLASSARRAI